MLGVIEMNLLDRLKNINTVNLRALADWLDRKYKDDPTPQVQTDLRQWADDIEQAIAQLGAPSEPTELANKIRIIATQVSYFEWGGFDWNEIAESLIAVATELNRLTAKLKDTESFYAAATKALYTQIKINNRLTSEAKQLKEKLHLHEGVEGGISAICGHPIQCLYAAAKEDGGPVCCSMCDDKRTIEKLQETIENVKRILKG